MRWIEPKPEYTAGDKRVARKFLWLPTKPVFSREWRWLEVAYLYRATVVGKGHCKILVRSEVERWEEGKDELDGKEKDD